MNMKVLQESEEEKEEERQRASSAKQKSQTWCVGLEEGWSEIIFILKVESLWA